MGKLVDGVWRDVWYDTKSTGGRFVRTNATFRNWVTPDGENAPSGKIQMKLGGGHQAIQANAIGTTKWDEDAGKMTLVDIEYYSATCVNPPEGVKAVEWIKDGFKSAKCD